jgi:hypothetical protein
MCVGGELNIGIQGGWPALIWAQVFWGIKPPLLYVMQRCQVPSGWMGPSHSCANGWLAHRGFLHPALVGGAEAISPPVITTAANPPTMSCLMVVSHRTVAGMTLPLR